MSEIWSRFHFISSNSTNNGRRKQTIPRWSHWSLSRLTSSNRQNVWKHNDD